MRTCLTRGLLGRLLAAAFVALGCAGCSGQGEGELCDQKAGGTPPGTSDCSDILQCTAAPGVVNDPTFGICCPPPGVAPTTTACSSRGLQGNVMFGGDGSAGNASTADAASASDGAAADGAAPVADAAAE